MKKALVIGVILLFLGVGIQPALANEVSTNAVSDVEEDCLECQPASRVDLLKVKLLLIRLEAITNVILSKFGHIPEIKEKCEKILETIHSDNDLFSVIICGIAGVLLAYFVSLIVIFSSIAAILGEYSYPLFVFFQYVAAIFIIPSGGMSSLR